MKSERIGSSFDDFLKEEGVYEKIHADVKRVVSAWVKQQVKKERDLGK